MSDFKLGVLVIVKAIVLAPIQIPISIAKAICDKIEDIGWEERYLREIRGER